MIWELQILHWIVVDSIALTEEEAVKIGARVTKIFKMNRKYKVQVRVFITLCKERTVKNVKLCWCV